MKQARETFEDYLRDYPTTLLYGGKRDEKAALAKVRAKYLDQFLHFFLGTTQEFHFRAPNPWVIVGVFPIPHERQAGLL